MQTDPFALATSQLFGFAGEPSTVSAVGPINLIADRGVASRIYWNLKSLTLPSLAASSFGGVVGSGTFPVRSSSFSGQLFDSPNTPISRRSSTNPFNLTHNETDGPQINNSATTQVFGQLNFASRLSDGQTTLGARNTTTSGWSTLSDIPPSRYLVCAAATSRFVAGNNVFLDEAVWGRVSLAYMIGTTQLKNESNQAVTSTSVQFDSIQSRVVGYVNLGGQVFSIVRFLKFFTWYYWSPFSSPLTVEYGVTDTDGFVRIEVVNSSTPDYIGKFCQASISSFDFQPQFWTYG